MINFIKNNIENKSGKYYRINDIISFIKDHVDVSITHDKYDYENPNIISSLPDYGRMMKFNCKEPSILYVMISNIILEDFGMNLLNYNTFELFMTEKRNRIMHNSYYNYIFNKNNLNSIFIPMVLLKEIETFNYSKKFQYGIFIRNDQPIFEYVFDIINFFGKENILFLTDCQIFKESFYLTNDKNYFFNSVETIIDVSSKYYSSHIGSRFIFEAISCKKNIMIIQDSNFNDIQNRTLKQFRSLNIIDRGRVDFKYYTIVTLNPKLVMLDSYSSYILEVFDKINSYDDINIDTIKSKFIEDYLR